MWDNLLSTHLLPKDFSTREKHAKSSEGGPKAAPVKNFKDSNDENMIVAHL